MTIWYNSFFECVDDNNLSLLDNLLFGNGFSLNFSGKFAYNFLYKTSENQFNPSDKSLFKLLETENFEDVLKTLYTAQKVDQMFKINESPIKQSYYRIKNVLINSIREVHPEFEDLPDKRKNQLKSAFEVFNKNIFTTNYDLLSYWALLGKRVKICDGFNWNENKTHLVFNENTMNSDDHKDDLKLFFLHGALHLYTDEEDVIKISKIGNDSSLLKAISNQYNLNQKIIPLYITEGDWKEKLRKINSNKYLTYCYSKLKSSTGGLTIFGQGLDETHDRHLINAVIDSDVESIAFGIHDNKDREIARITDLFKKSPKKVLFFDSNKFLDEDLGMLWFLVNNPALNK